MAATWSWAALACPSSTSPAARSCGCSCASGRAPTSRHGVRSTRGGALLGTFGNIAAQVVNLGQVDANLPQVQTQQAVDTARSAASWAVLGLGLSIAASALGGVIGARIWPRKRHVQPGGTYQG